MYTAADVRFVSLLQIRMQTFTPVPHILRTTSYVTLCGYIVRPSPQSVVSNRLSPYSSQRPAKYITPAAPSVSRDCNPGAIFPIPGRISNPGIPAILQNLPLIKLFFGENRDYIAPALGHYSFFLALKN